MPDTSLWESMTNGQAVGMQQFTLVQPQVGGWSLEGFCGTTKPSYCSEKSSPQCLQTECSMLSPSHRPHVRSAFSGTEGEGSLLGTAAQCVASGPSHNFVSTFPVCHWQWQPWSGLEWQDAAIDPTWVLPKRPCCPSLWVMIPHDEWWSLSFSSSLTRWHSLLVLLVFFQWTLAETFAETYSEVQN